MSKQAIKLTVGGTVQANNGTYLKRPADEELFEACLNREFCYVLACRQIGKSSLMIATAERLEAEGIRVARLDLNRIGESIPEAGNNVEKADIWYFSLLDEIARNLRLKTNIEAWWDSQPLRSTFTLRFVRFFDEVVLNEISKPVVIFIDEIDITLGMPFTDDFFAAIRSLYNDRAQYPVYKRLTFVLLGVATPDELIQDNRRTPFNIGRAISMHDFTRDECTPLRMAIKTKHSTLSDIYFDKIYNWTNGHPYLTQKLCQQVINSPQTNEPNLVDKLVNQIFLTDKEHSSDHNIQFVQTRVLGDSLASEMLLIYYEVLTSDEYTIYINEKLDAIYRLELYGLIFRINGNCFIRNEIYREVFDINWAYNYVYENNKGDNFLTHINRPMHQYIKK